MLSIPSETRSASSPRSSPDAEAKRRTSRLSGRDRAALRLQLVVGRISAPLWIPFTVALMRFGFGWRISGLAEARRRFRAIQGSGPRPVVLCANHLTLVDSAIIAWALGSPWWYLRRFSSLPWNVPERRNFASSRLQRVLVYLMKCVPITRGGDRRQIGTVLERLVHLLSRGETILIFPEGGRSRSGRIDLENHTYGAGRLIGEMPACKVVCVYLRGEGQDTWSELPARGERFRIRIESIDPKSERGGLRGSIEVSRQILSRLDEMEKAYFEGRFDDRQ